MCWGLAIGPREGVLLGANLVRAIETNGGIYGVRVRQCLDRLSCGLGWCVRWAEALLYWMGVHVVQREGEVLGVFVPLFQNGKCHCIVDGEMFPIRMRKLDNISVRQRIVGKLDSWAFWRYIQFQDQSWGL